MGFWKPGTHASGYRKNQLGSGRFPFSWNLTLYKYPKGSFIPWHKSQGYSGRHYYFHIELWPAWRGGILEVVNEIWGFPRREPYFIFFRADRSHHQVTEVLEGTKLVLILSVII